MRSILVRIQIVIAVKKLPMSLKFWMKNNVIEEQILNAQHDIYR